MDLTENLILQKTKVTDLNLVKNLNLWGSELSGVDMVARLPNLEVLTLSVNKVSSLRDIGQCKSLRELYLRKNDVASLGEVHYLSKLPKLSVLWLCDNPCASHPLYRLFTIRCCPELKQLDNVEISPQERAEAQKLTQAQMSEVIGQAARGPPQQQQQQAPPAPPQQPPQQQQQHQAEAAVPSRVPRQDKKPMNPERLQHSPAHGNPAAVAAVAAGGGNNPPPPSSSSRQTQKTVVTAIVTLLNELNAESLEFLHGEIGHRIQSKR